MRPAFVSSLSWWPRTLKILGVFMRNVSDFSTSSGDLEGYGHMLI